MNQLYLIRHGENHANLTKEFSYRKVDYSLTPKGILQAAQTARFLQGKGIHEIFTSPLKRAYETAQIIGDALGLPVTPLEAFREENVGDLEGQKPTAELWEFHNRLIDGWFHGHPEVRFPGGENYHELVNRATSGFAEILRGKTSRRIIVVGHGGIFSFTLLAVLPKEDIERMNPLNGGLPNCSISELEAQMVDERLELHLHTLGQASHLSGEAAELVPGSPEAGELE